MSVYGIAGRLKNWEEKVTRSQKTIDTDHAFIHKGVAYDVWDSLRDLNGERIIGIVTPAGKYLHFRPANLTVAGGMIRFRIYECATSTGTAISGGAATSPVNRSFHSDNESGTVVRMGAASSSTGDYTEKYSTKLFAGRNTGDNVSEPLEWIFKPAVTYAIYLNTTANTEYNLNLFWYEEDDG